MAHVEQPHDLEAETAVLGSILLEPDALIRVLDVLEPDDFYRENNGLIYRAACHLSIKSRPIDNVTMAAELEKLGVLEQIGGRGHLALLQDSVPTAANVEHYAAIVKDRANKRRLLKVSQEGAGLAVDPALSADEALELVSRRVAEITSNGAVHAEQIAEPLHEALTELEQRLAHGGGPTGLPSGLRDLDRVTSGFKAGDLVLVAGRPSMGKTSLAVQFAANAALHEGQRVAIFSLEMSKVQLAKRLLSQEARVDSSRIERAVLSDEEHGRLVQSSGPLYEAPILVDDRAALDELQLLSEARRLKQAGGLGLIVVDYLQLMAPRQRSREGNRVQEVSALSRALKLLAKDVQVPLVVVSQLNRSPEARPDNRPRLADLRESGGQEQDADLVILLYREEYYNREKSQKPGIAELIIAKNRNGPTDTVDVCFRKECTRFEDLARQGVPA